MMETKDISWYKNKAKQLKDIVQEIRQLSGFVQGIDFCSSGTKDYGNVIACRIVKERPPSAMIEVRLNLGEGDLVKIIKPDYMANTDSNYLFIFEDGIVRKSKEVHPDDLTASEDGYLQIIRLSDLKTHQEGDQWVDLSDVKDMEGADSDDDTDYLG